MICEAGFLQASHAPAAGMRRIAPTLGASIVRAMALKTRVKSRPVAHGSAGDGGRHRAGQGPADAGVKP
jgi:hypothetical protein